MNQQIESTTWHITKENGDLGICLDPTDLNKGSEREHNYTRTLEEILPKLKNAKYSVNLMLAQVIGTLNLTNHLNY